MTHSTPHDPLKPFRPIVMLRITITHSNLEDLLGPAYFGAGPSQCAFNHLHPTELLKRIIEHLSVPYYGILMLTIQKLLFYVENVSF